MYIDFICSLEIKIFLGYYYVINGQKGDRQVAFGNVLSIAITAFDNNAFNLFQRIPAGLPG